MNTCYMYCLNFWAFSPKMGTEKKMTLYHVLFTGFCCRKYHTEHWHFCSESNMSHLFVECGNRTLKIFPLSSMSKYFPIWHLKGHLYGYYFSRFNILSAITNGLVLPSPFGCHFPKPLRKNDNYCHSQKGAMLQN